LTGTPPPGTPAINLPPLSPSAGNTGAPASSSIGSGLPDLNVAPPRDNMSAPNPNIPPTIDAPGAMGSPNPMPSPN
jgi:hypothetical protein